jgi:hypothetical protein
VARPISRISADAGAYQHAGVGDEHDLVFGLHQSGGYHFAVALRLLDGDHALGTATMACVFRNAGAFAVTVFGGGQHAGAGASVVFSAFDFCSATNMAMTLCVVFDHHAAHATGATTQGTHIVFVKAHGFAAVAEQHHVVLAVGEGSADQEVALVQIDSDDAAFAWVVEFV